MLIEGGDRQISVWRTQMFTCTVDVQNKLWIVFTSNWIKMTGCNEFTHTVYINWPEIANSCSPTPRTDECNFVRYQTTLFGYEQPKHPKLCIADLLYGEAGSFSKKGSVTRCCIGMRTLRASPAHCEEKHWWLGGFPYKGPVVRSFGDCFVVSRNKLLNKLTSCWGYGTSWRLHDFIVMMRRTL